MFSTLGLFGSVTCPEGLTCSLLNCIFSHPHPIDSVSTSERLQTEVGRPQSASAAEAEPSRKRLRKSEDNGAQHGLTLSKKSPDSEHSGNVKGRTEPPKQRSKPADTSTPVSQKTSPAPLSQVSNASVQTPATRETAQDESPLLQAKRARKLKAEPLVPRLLPKAPAPHSTRHQLISLVFDQVARLNEAVKQSDDAFKAALELSQQEVIKHVLDEEERVARAQPAIYGNVMKLRVVALKKMGLAAWKAERETQIARDFPGLSLTGKKRKDPVVIDTGLTPEEENALLPNLVTPLAGLDKHGYVLVAPSAAEVEEARRAVETAAGWEHCDRCQSRFQVFPGRRASDGALTSGGACTYHHGKQRRPIQDKGSRAANGPTEAQYTCCLKELGTPGCTTAPTHVFKASDPKRLSLATSFERTEARGDRATNGAVCVDCEMAYTTCGMELARLTATAWPGGAPLVDVLVRPVGEVLDLNTRFSGVTAADMTAAKPYDADAVAATVADGGPLPLVGSPAEARGLLLRYLTPQTPLIGHALENDLNAVRLIHFTIVDTVLLYPHPKGLPVRYGLRMLMDRHLNRQIQTAGEHGHDSKEDARAAGDLLRLKVAEKWKAMKREGWKAKDGVFYPPDGEADRGKALERHMKV